MTDSQDVAKAVLGNIMLSPELHEQADYGRSTSCGTKMCVAGWAVHLFKPEMIRWNESYDGAQVMVHAETGNAYGIHKEAAKLLGLNDLESHSVFMSDNENAIKQLMRLARGKKVKV